MPAAKKLAGVTPEVNLKEHATCTPPPNVNKAARSGFQNPPEVQNRGISDPTIRTNVIQKIKKEKTSFPWD